MKKVLLGLSGGMDSAVAAKLLADRGYCVEGAVLQMHDYTEVAEAEACAEALGIPLHVVDCKDAFSKAVIADFLRAYRCGETPNPCIRCNAEVKFRVLWQYAKAQGFDKIATGHYAGVGSVGDRFAVCMAKDGAKDQSYMLYRLEQDILKDLVLPLADCCKNDLKPLAGEIREDLPLRPESQEICFIKNEKYTDYLERHLGAFTPGEFVDEEGRVLGTHRGIGYYTVGQRKGLGVSAATRLFVKRIDTERNRIVLSADTGTLRSSFYLDHLVYQGTSPTELVGEYTLMLRYRARLKRGVISWENGRCHVQMTEEGVTATPGQSAVVYQDGKVVFGGIICF